uniref:Uncharacterized protein n=1 Tax=Chelonoidis abingdonii TaxID=106734 RepID=A0A8C0IW23_CHEAB
PPPPLRLLLVSNSTLRGEGPNLFAQVVIMLSVFPRKVNRLLFIPYALHDRDAYAKTTREKFESLGYELDSIHESSDPVEVVRKSEAIFIGNFLLQCCFILQDGIPYMESSAGTNVASISISTTSDMPIMYLPSLQVLGLVPFNISPHYLDPDVNSTHMGVTWGFISCQIQGLGEGAMLLVEGDKATLQGVTEARLFLRGEKPTEHEPGTDFSFLLIVTPRSPDLSCSETPDAKGR